ncbi:MAG: hypothetical protein ACLR8Y_13010 [Alistipes indistinctus]
MKALLKALTEKSGKNSPIFVRDYRVKNPSLGVFKRRYPNDKAPPLQGMESMITGYLRGRTAGQNISLEQSAAPDKIKFSDRRPRVQSAGVGLVSHLAWRFTSVSSARLQVYPESFGIHLVRTGSSA